MKNPNDHIQLIEIYKLLFEIATGSRNRNIFKTEIKTELDQLYNILMNFNELLQKYLQKNHLYMPIITQESLSQFIFILNNDLQIKGVNQEVSNYLNYSSEELVHINFENLIAADFLHIWKQIIHNRNSKTNAQYLKLTFSTSEGKMFPTFCSIHRLVPNNEIIVTSIITEKESTIKLQKEWYELNNKDIIEKNFSLKLYNYIMENLNKQLPSLHIIARELGTEEHLLKTGFKKYYKTSVYQLYQDERLKRAEDLILQTDIPLKQIAHICGFKSYLNFYKSFKKKFLYTPSDLNRRCKK